MEIPKYKNVAFKGGGILGMAYTGAILGLENVGILQGIEKVSGTSAGSIAAMLVAMKLDAKQIFDISSSVNFSSFEDGNFLDKIRVVNKYGIHPGDKFLNWIKSIVGEITFQEFHDKGYLDLHVFATDLNTQSLKRFCVSETPQIKVCDAIRASMAIPFFFDAYEIENHIYVDGGLIYNYPLTAFDSDIENVETLGLFIGNVSEAFPDSDLTFGELKKYSMALIQTLLNAQNINLAKDLEDVKRTVFIDNLGISPINFGITIDQKIALFKSGQEAVLIYFK